MPSQKILSSDSKATFESNLCGKSADSCHNSALALNITTFPGSSCTQTKKIVNAVCPTEWD